MGKSVFVSYKYSDSKVQPLAGVSGKTTARDYVDAIDKLLEAGDHIFKGEDDNESMATLEDSTIASKLGDKIFYSSVTIVLISKGMKRNDIPEKDQWIPWEISYSLKEQSRNGGNSKTNAMLAVVLPDENGSYEYFLVENPICNSTTYLTQTLFRILGENMFNLKTKEDNVRHCGGTKIYDGYHSYIHTVKWNYFINNVNGYIAVSDGIRQRINEYDVVKNIK